LIISDILLIYFSDNNILIDYINQSKHEALETWMYRKHAWGTFFCIKHQNLQD